FSRYWSSDVCSSDLGARVRASVDHVDRRERDLDLLASVDRAVETRGNRGGVGLLKCAVAPPDLDPDQPGPGARGDAATANTHPEIGRPSCRERENIA